MIKRSQHPVDELELMAYLDGELSRERAAATAAHLEACSECKALAKDLRGVSQELAKWQIETSDIQVTDRLSVALEDHQRAHEKAKQSSRAEGKVWGRRTPWAWALTGTGLIVIAIAWGLNFLRTPEPLAKRETASTYFSPAPPPNSKGGRSQSVDGQPPVGNGPPDRQEKEQLTQWLPAGPMVVRTAELTLSTTDFDRSRSRIEEILKRHNGYLGDLNVSGASSSARVLTATLRVPSSQLDATIAELKGLGRVEEESQKGEEVSQQYVDLQARLLNARNSEQRLTELLRRAGKLSDVLAVEEQIENVRESIERMEAERENLAKQIQFSTLNMQVTEEFKERVHVVPDSASTRFRNAAVEGYEVMVAGLINLLLFLISWGPSLLLWGAILFFPARWLWRRRQRGIF